MVIDLSYLKKNKGESETFRFAEQLPPITFQGEEYVFAAPAAVSGTVTNTGFGFLVQGKVHGTLHLHCSRCLTEFDYHLQTTVAALYRESLTAEPAEEPEEPEDEETDVYTFSGETIDLQDAVQESIVLALPMKALCREDCRGLCPHCGQNLNLGTCACAEQETDSRLAALRQLLKD